MLRIHPDHEDARADSPRGSDAIARAAACSAGRLCYVEGLTHERATARLRCPVGTVRSRLARGRALLQHRLARRGLTISIRVLAITTVDSMAATIPPQLLRSTVELATRIGVQTAQTRLASESVINLVEGVLNVMNLRKIVFAVSGAS